MPLAAASITLPPTSISGSRTSPAVVECSVSGNTILPITSAAGADITLAAIRWPAGIPIAMYPASTPPAMVAKPPTMIVSSSDRVIWSRNGLIRSGASVWPTKMLAVHDRVSAPLVPMVHRMNRAIASITRCMMPRWYSTAMNPPKKMMVGSTLKANWKPKPGQSAAGPGKK